VSGSVTVGFRERIVEQTRSHDEESELKSDLTDGLEDLDIAEEVRSLMKRDEMRHLNPLTPERVRGGERVFERGEERSLRSVRGEKETGNDESE
jgi:hypothetical protein